MAGKRQLNLGEFRQREYLIGDIGWNEIEDAGADRVDFRLRLIGGGDFGAPWFAFATGHRDLGKQRKTEWHPLERQIGFGRMPIDGIDFVIELDVSVGDLNGLKARQSGVLAVAAPDNSRESSSISADAEVCRDNFAGPVIWSDLPEAPVWFSLCSSGAALAAVSPKPNSNVPEAERLTKMRAPISSIRRGTIIGT